MSMALGFWSRLPDRGVTAAEVAAVLPADVAEDMGERVVAHSSVSLADCESNWGTPDEPLTDLLVESRAYHRITTDGAGLGGWARTGHVRPEDLPGDRGPRTRAAAFSTLAFGDSNGSLRGRVAHIEPSGDRSYLTDDGTHTELSERELRDARRRLDGEAERPAVGTSNDTCRGDDTIPPVLFGPE